MQQILPLCEPHNSKLHKTTGKQERAFIELVLHYLLLGYETPFVDAFKAYIPGCQNGVNRTASVIDGSLRLSNRGFEDISLSTIWADRRNLALLDDSMSDIGD